MPLYFYIGVQISSFTLELFVFDNLFINTGLQLWEGHAFEIIWVVLKRTEVFVFGSGGLSLGFSSYTSGQLDVFRHYCDSFGVNST